METPRALGMVAITIRSYQFEANLPSGSVNGCFSCGKMVAHCGLTLDALDTLRRLTLLLKKVDRQRHVTY
jgi:hypothetical protein